MTEASIRSCFTSWFRPAFTGSYYLRAHPFFHIVNLCSQRKMRHFQLLVPLKNLLDIFVE